MSLSYSLREAAKKVLFLVAGQLKRGGGEEGGKGLATKKKLCLKLLEKSLFFDKFVAIFGKKYGSFSTKILWRFLLLSEIVSGKFLFILSSRGRGVRP